MSTTYHGTPTRLRGDWGQVFRAEGSPYVVVAYADGAVALWDADAFDGLTVDPEPVYSVTTDGTPQAVNAAVASFVADAQVLTRLVPEGGTAGA